MSISGKTAALSMSGSFTLALFSSPVSADEVALRDIISATPQEPIAAVMILSQDALLTGQDPGMSQEIGGGIVGGLALGVFNSVVEGGARDAMASSRELFTRQEAEAILLGSINAILRDVAWLTLREGSALRDNSEQAKLALLEQGNAQQLLIFDCSYNVSARFQAVYSACAINLLDKAALAGTEQEPAEKRYSASLQQSFFVEAQVETANPARSVGGRREQLTANGGRLLRNGLEHALKKTAELLEIRLSLSAEEISAAAQNERYRFVTAYVGMAGEHRGRVISGEENIHCRYYPNNGGLSYQYRDGASGMIVIERKRNLFYHWTQNDPEGPEIKDCR